VVTNAAGGNRAPRRTECSAEVCAAATARPGPMADAPLGHADAMQIILFCMAYFLAVKLFRYLLDLSPGEIRTPDPQIRSPIASKSAAHVPGFQGTVAV
jgi:hypothetical protein